MNGGRVRHDENFFFVVWLAPAFGTMAASVAVDGNHLWGIRPAVGHIT
jgi:hypothetical protein